jgi:hypothetical protein
VRPRAVFGLLLLGGVLLVLATPAHAGPVVITLEQLPAKLHARQPFTVDFMVVSHGFEGQLAPMAGLAPEVTATLGNEHVRVFAEPAETPGHYQATLTLPVPGTWAWGIAAFGGPETYALTPLQVDEAVGGSGAALPTAEPVAPASWMRALLRVAGVVLLIVALVLPLVRSRRAGLPRTAGPA